VGDVQSYIPSFLGAINATNALLCSTGALPQSSKTFGVRVEGIQEDSDA